jgi:dGTPase
VASVGRSLGAIVGNHLAEYDIDSKDQLSQNFYKIELSNVISAGCLAHDVGNPAFGHSGEEAISHYFRENENKIIGGRVLRSYFKENEWSDLIQFEGNANALRILTQNYAGKGKGGLGLTVSTLASILKYPCESGARNRTFKHRKKYGYFYAEKDIFRQIVAATDMLKDNHEKYLIYKRHPFVYLVEAADDICYNIIDMEDAHRLGILSREVVSYAFLQLLMELNRKEDNIHAVKDTYTRLTDDNAAISYLRSKVINSLVAACADIFILNKNVIRLGEFNSTLMGELEQDIEQLDIISNLSRSKIYNHRSVVEIEIAGFNVMSELLSLFVPACLTSDLDAKSKAAIKLLPPQYAIENHLLSPYQNVMLVLDHVSAMTDDYATEMYRKIKGIEISRHS